MRLNRSRTAAVLALAGICFCFLGGCGSQQKASQPPAMPAPNTEKTAAEPDVASPGTKTLDATGPESPVLKTPKPEKDLGLKQVKKATPPKAMARPTQAQKSPPLCPAKSNKKSTPCDTRSSRRRKPIQRGRRNLLQKNVPHLRPRIRPETRKCSRAGKRI